MSYELFNLAKYLSLRLYYKAWGDLPDLTIQEVVEGIPKEKKEKIDEVFKRNDKICP